MAERQGRDHAHAGHRHEAACCLIGLCQTANLVVELALLLAYVIVDRQEWLDDDTELVIVPEQLDDSLPELKPNGSSEQKPVFLDHAADLVFDIPANPNKTRSRDKDGADPLAFLALDLHLSIPADPNQFGQTPGVVLVAFVHADRQRRMRMPS